MQPLSGSLRHARGSSLLLAALAAYACSFQNFDYLEAGSGASGGSGGSGESGGQSAVGGNGGKASGGVATAGESSGGASTQGGGPALGGHGGDPAGGAAGSDAGVGAAGAGGDGGTSVGGAGVGGAGAGTGADGGVGGVGGVGGSDPGTGGGRTTLANPSFELGSTGWTIDPAVAATNRYIFFQFPPTGATAVDGSYIASVWHATDEYQFTVSQALDGLEDGLYTFKGNFSSTLAREVYVFARNCGGTDMQEPVATNSFPWHEVGISGINVVGGHCEVGFFIHGIANDWLNVDLLSFERDPQ